MPERTIVAVKTKKERLKDIRDNLIKDSGGESPGYIDGVLDMYNETVKNA